MGGAKAVKHKYISTSGVGTTGAPGAGAPPLFSARRLATPSSLNA